MTPLDSCHCVIPSPKVWTGLVSKEKRSWAAISMIRLHKVESLVLLSDIILADFDEASAPLGKPI